jgi:predicted Zn-dependent protease
MHGRISARPVALVLALMMSVAVANAQTKIKSGFNLFSAEQDVQIGQQSAAEAEAQLPVLRDQAIESYINRIGQKLAQKTSTRSPFPADRSTSTAASSSSRETKVKSPA